MGKFIDMTGTEFGDYIVDSFDNTKGEYKYYWNCHCKKCGAKKSVASSSIKNGKSARCNVCNEDFGRREVCGFHKDLTGKKIGSLTVIKYAYSKGTHSHWVCRCDCGNICTVSINFFKRNINLMCPKCIKKFSNIYNVLENNNRDVNGRVINKIKFANHKPNKYIFLEDKVIINDRVIIDKEDFDFVDSFERYVSIDTRGYAYFSYGRKEVYLHRLLSKAPLFCENFETDICDHINGNRLDNRKANLRIIKRFVNPVNCGVRIDNKSGCKGVSWLERLKKWQVNIQFQKRNHYIGVFKNFEDAVKARKEAEIKYFGDLNRSNL